MSNDKSQESILNVHDENSSVFKKFTDAALSKNDRGYIKKTVNSFLFGAEELSFANQTQELFKLQPLVGEDKNSSRNEVLLSGGRFFNSLIKDELVLEEDPAIKQAIEDQLYFDLYHYLARYWALKNYIDVSDIKDTELVLCYKGIALGSELLCILQNKKYSEVKPQIDKLKVEIKNYIPSSLDKSAEELNSSYVISLLRRFNAIRLYWVWVREVIEMYVADAHNALLLSTNIAGQISWSLYLSLALVSFSGIFDGTYQAYKNENGKKIAAWKVFQAHLNLRRDNLANDLIWGVINLACFFWLYGPGVCGYVGDVLTGFLLIADLTMGLWRYSDDKKEYTANMNGYDNELKKLLQQVLGGNQAENIIDDIIAGKTDIESFLQDRNNDEDKIILWKVKRLLEAKENCKDSFEKKRKLLITSIIYAIVLFIAFSALCSFYLSIIPVSLPLSVISLSAFILGGGTLVWRSINYGIESSYMDKSHRLAENKFDDLFNKFIDLAKNENISENKLKQLYLQILQKGADLGYQEENIFYAKLEFIRETINRVAIPVAVAMLLLLGPTAVFGVPTYLFLLAGVIAVNMMASYFIKSSYKPKPTKWDIQKQDNHSGNPVFVDKEYAEFKLKASSNNKDQMQHIIKASRTGNNLSLFSKANFSDDSPCATSSFLYL